MEGQIFELCNQLNIEINSKFSDKAKELFRIWKIKSVGNQIAGNSQQAVPYIILHLASEQRQMAYPVNTAIEFSGLNRQQYFTVKDVVAGHLGIQVEQSFSHYAIRLGSSGLQDFCNELKSIYQNVFKKNFGSLQYNRQNWDGKELFGSILSLCCKYLGIKIPRDIQNEIKGTPKIFKNYCSAIETDCKDYLLAIHKKYGKLSSLKSKESPSTRSKKQVESDLSVDEDEIIAATYSPTVIHSPVKKVSLAGRISKDTTPKKSTPLKQSFKNISPESDLDENQVSGRSLRSSKSDIIKKQDSPSVAGRLPLRAKSGVESDGGSNKSTPTKPQSTRKTPKTQTIKRVADQNLAITPNEDEHPTPSKSVRSRKSLGLKEPAEPETPSTPVKHHKRSLEQESSANKKPRWTTSTKSKKTSAITGIHSMVTVF
ncbi:hypothetical protein HDV06_001678 [Boothiomyces sp. JEL0866]|nr:hypothetical protein HDV06_001678 [Boothiomyces sp. JEL0866]